MKLCVIEGDGIGHEVVPAAVSVLQAVLPQVEIVRAEAGYDYHQRTGRPIDPETFDLVRACGALLYGAANSPSFPVQGYSSPIVRLRRELKTYAALRPTVTMPVATSRPGVDLLVVREATEDVYSGEEHQHFDSDSETMIAQKIVTRAASERIAHMAFSLARRGQRRRVTIVHKGNVLPMTDGLFRRAALEIAAYYPEIEVDELLVDTAAYWMVKDPSRFDIILTMNQYGDILSDMAAAWGGGLGLSPALNLGDEVGIAEPVHGSAPDIAGQNIANPTATILSLAMLIRYHWGLNEAAERIEAAVYRALGDGLYTADIRPQDALSTTQFTEAILARLA